MKTREITREKIPEVRKLTENGFAMWLLVGFLEYEENTGNLTPFGEAWAFTGRREDITDDIADVHNVLLPAERVLFRRGLAKALAELDIKLKSGIVTARRLILLAGKVLALNVLSILPGKVFSASWLSSTESGRELLALASDVVIDLASNTEDSYTTLKELVVSPAFDIQKSSARKALVALCKASPDNLDKALQLLAAHLHWMFVEREKETSRSLADERARLFLQIAKLVPSHVLYQTIKTYNSETRVASLHDKLSWWGDVLTGRGANSQNAAALNELARKLQIAEPLEARSVSRT